MIFLLGTAPETVKQVEGCESGSYIRGQRFESEICCWIQLRKYVTLAMTDGAPAWHPSMPQETTPMLS